MVRVALSAWWMLMLFSGDQLRVSVNPAVMMAGNTVILTCHVPKHPDNRLLEYGIIGTQVGSQRQRDGSASPITWQFEIKRVECESGPAYCAVRDSHGQWTRVTAQIQVAGCQEKPFIP